MAHQHEIHSHYLKQAFNPARVKKFVRAAVPLLKRYDFEAIAFRGMSGALIAPVLAYRCNKTLVMVRKPKQNAYEDHSDLRIEGDAAMQRYLIVDDFMCSGTTVMTTIREINAFAPQAKCLGALFYNRFMLDGRAPSITNLLGCMPSSLHPYLVHAPDDFLLSASQKLMTTVCK
jgi:hypothetical protein